MDASVTEPGIRRSRAIRLLNTTTMQKVVCPATIVSALNWIPANEKKEFSATPVMMPGSAIGSTSSSESHRAARTWESFQATENQCPQPMRSRVVTDDVMIGLTSHGRTIMTI